MKKQNNKKTAGGLLECSLTISTKDGILSEIMRQVLRNNGFEESQIVERDDGYLKTLSVYLDPRERHDVLKKSVFQVKWKHVLSRVRLLKKEDWHDRWKEDFKPFDLTPTITVVPYWDKKGFKGGKGRRALVIKAIDAFGTGLHETTAAMARLIEKCAGRFATFCDVGTGSGILSIVAFLNRATHIMALDIDQKAVKAARINARMNGMAFDKIAVGNVAHLGDQRHYDFVAANLISHDLIQHQAKLLRLVQTGGYLAVSGISNEHLDIVRDAFRPLPLRCLKIEKGKYWAAVLYKRIATCQKRKNPKRGTSPAR